MTRKQINKLANELVKLELIHRNPQSTREEIVRAEKRIMSITNQLMAGPNGLVTMMDVDAIVQSKLNAIIKEN